MKVTTNTTMTLSHFHDFYFLQALEHSVMTEISVNQEMAFSKAVETLQADITEAQEEISSNIALRTFVYLYAACLGEARHAAGPEAGKYFIPSILQKSRSRVYEDAIRYRPDKHNIGVIISIFDQRWGSGFGGDAWKAIAESLLKYYNEPAASFIDHVIDLEHNNGTAFSKSDAKETIFFDVEYDGRFSTFLDYKFRFDILSKSGNSFYKVTPRVYKLIQRYCIIFKKKFPHWLDPVLPKLGDYLVEWGDEHLQCEEKWMEGATVYKKNKPDPDQIVYAAALHRLAYNGKDYFEFCDEVKNAAKPIVEKFFNTPYLKGRVNARLREHIEARMFAFKPVFQYSFLPVKLEYKEQNDAGYRDVYIHLPVHIKGIGKKNGKGTIIKTTLFTYKQSMPESTAEAVLYKRGVSIYLEGQGFRFSPSCNQLHLFLKGE